jgi:hypothetical protein
MGAFARVTRTTAGQPGQGIVAEVSGKTFASLHVDGACHAIDNTCIQRRGPRGEGDLEGSVVTLSLAWLAMRCESRHLRGESRGERGAICRVGRRPRRHGGDSTTMLKQSAGIHGPWRTKRETGENSAP